jgi:hypothetical protein
MMNHQLQPEPHAAKAARSNDATEAGEMRGLFRTQLARGCVNAKSRETTRQAT